MVVNYWTCHTVYIYMYIVNGRLGNDNHVGNVTCKDSSVWIMPLPSYISNNETISSVWIWPTCFRCALWPNIEYRQQKPHTKHTKTTNKKHTNNNKQQEACDNDTF